MSLYTEEDNQHMLEGYAREVRRVIEDEITDDTYRNIANNAEQRLAITHLLSQSPYGVEGPLAHSGGLLVHTAHLIRLARCLANSCSEINGTIDYSFLVVGAWLRNVGWHTTTAIMDGQVKRRDAFLTTGIRRAGFRFTHDLLLHAESDLEINIPETKKQALTNIFAEPGEITTLEGRLIEDADIMIQRMVWAEHHKDARTGNWSPDHNGLFVGHYGQ